ncbi:ATP-dependent Zn protease [Vibrio sp. 10N.286.49.B3]|uniref:putative ATP-dependent zinc protease n=1 Tax=Vibrio sp. 10N.286.49.B3 TaxID=1880855 RepID=UPI000C83E525|nr:RimK/LysX family protein [Vibrio sp. 10N.286.49.B3]PMH41394.1 ATP-dependent Zn protease [Vibrio sp. 10N.286.49.B3]
MKALKHITPLLFCGMLAACSSTPPQAPIEEVVEPEVAEPIPEVTPEIKPEPTPEVPVEVEPKPEIKPEPEIKPDKPPVAKPQPTKTDDGLLLLGEQEWLYIPSLKKSFKARVDTGATTSSISASEIQEFERDSKTWITFRIQHSGVKSDEFSLPVERWVKISQANSDESVKRPVIVIPVQLGDLKEKVEFTLTDRSHLTYPVLLGRSFFRDIAIVDVSKTFIQPKVNTTNSQ